MDKQTEREIFEAVKTDDLKKFASLIVSNSDLNLCFGRFPLLSLCYLFSSYKILNKYEKYMLGISNFNFVDEYGEAYIKLKQCAGLCLRFCDLNSILYPAEILALLGETETLAKNYKKLFKNAKIIENINKICNFRLKNQKTEATDLSFVSTQKPKVKNKIILSAISLLLVVFIILPVIFINYVKTSSGLGTSSLPVLINDERALKTALGGKKSYKLMSDITLTDEICASSFSGTFDGNGHTIILSENQTTYLIENLSGKISNVNFVITASSLEISESSSFLANISSGTVVNCVFSGDVLISFVGKEDADFSVVAIENNGTFDEIVSDVSISAKNVSSQNVTVSGLCSVNNGVIQNCKTCENAFLTDTVDVAGLVIKNTGEIVNSTNNADISQTASGQWNPYVAGIAIQNYGTLSYVQNNGDLSATISSDDEDEHGVYLAGIVCLSANEISYAKNYGDLSASSSCAGVVYVAGISAYNALDEKVISDISNSYSSCNMNVVSTGDAVIYAGGIAGVSGTSIDNSGANVKISIDCTKEYYAGGLVGMNYSNYFNYSMTGIKNCYSIVTYDLPQSENQTETQTEGQSENQTAEDDSGSSTDGTQGYAGSLVGVYIGNYSSIYNCYYVSDESFTYPLYSRISLANQIYVYFGVSDAENYFMGYDTFDELKLSASGVTFYE